MPTPVRVVVKIGKISSTSRTNFAVEEPVFTFDERVHGYIDFCKKVEDRVAAGLRSYGKKTIRSDPTVYIKLSQSARQRDWVAVTEDSFENLVASAYSNYQRRTKDCGPFEIEVFVFAARKQRNNLTGTRRATAPRIQEAARTIDSFLEERSDLEVGEIARTHWSISHARQPEGTQLTVPDTATFAQAQHLDAMRSQEDVQEESSYQDIAARLNRSQEMPLTINVPELRRVLGLPNHNLLARGVFASFVPPADPEEDVSDDEHKSD